MDTDDVRQLASQGERQRLEFKRSLAELGTATRAVAAFANSDGGVLLFSVRDSRKFFDVKIGQTTRAHREPYHRRERLGRVSVGGVIQGGGREVIIVRVAPSDNRPRLVGDMLTNRLVRRTCN